MKQRRRPIKYSDVKVSVGDRWRPLGEPSLLRRKYKVTITRAWFDIDGDTKRYAYMSDNGRRNTITHKSLLKAYELDVAPECESKPVLPLTDKLDVLSLTDGLDARMLELERWAVTISGDLGCELPNVASHMYVKQQT